MEIAREDGTKIGSVSAHATRDEAWDLLVALVVYFCDDDGFDLVNLIAGSPDENIDSTHYHIGSPDELTLAIETPEALRPRIDR